MPPGAILLQVAASPRESDALALAGVLRQKGFAALILEPTADKFYRVELGPYTDSQSVRLAKRAQPGGISSYRAALLTRRCQRQRNAR